MIGTSELMGMVQPLEVDGPRAEPVPVQWGPN